MYGSAAYVLANTLAVVPFLFACTFLFSLISCVIPLVILRHILLTIYTTRYWAIGLRSGAIPFFRFTFYLFLGVMAAESQSVLIAALVPVFVAALAIAAFMNGFWMVIFPSRFTAIAPMLMPNVQCVQGYFIKATSLPRFWYYWAHWIVS